MKDKTPLKLSYVRIAPPPLRRRPHAALAVAIGLLPLAILWIIRIAPGPEDSNHVPFRYILRGLCFAWVGCVWLLIWSVRDQARRQRMWAAAQVSMPRDPADAAPQEGETKTSGIRTT